MKNKISKFVITCVVIALSMASCNKDYDVFDESSADKGVYVGIDGSPASELFYFNNATSSYKANMKVFGSLKITKMDSYAVLKSNVDGSDSLVLVKTTNFPASTWEVTLQDVATGLNTSLDSFDPGDQVILRNKLTTADGKVWSADNTSNLSGGLLSGAAYKNLLADVSVFVTCPFVADDAVGTYTVIRDDWEDVFPGDQLEVVKVDATTIDIVQYPTTKYNQVPVRVTVDPTSGVATVTKQYSGQYEDSKGNKLDAYTAGGGYVFSCAGYVTLTLDFTYAGSPYNGYTLIISK
jgi:hypothetical protein